jgi:hypothetical protein
VGEWSQRAGTTGISRLIFHLHTFWCNLAMALSDLLFCPFSHHAGIRVGECHMFQVLFDSLLQRSYTFFYLLVHARSDSSPFNVDLGWLLSGWLLSGWLLSGWHLGLLIIGLFILSLCLCPCFSHFL